MPTNKPHKLKLTDANIARLKPSDDGKMVTYWDTNMRGFGLRVSPLGRKTYLAQYRVKPGGGGKAVEVTETFATSDKVSLADAQEEARASFALARKGIHPVRSRKQARSAALAAEIEQAYTLDKLIEEFIRRYHQQKREPSRASTIYEVRRLLRRALPFIGDKPVRAIVKADILAMVNTLADTRLNKWRGVTTGGSLSEASGVLRHLRTCFRWAVDEDLVERDPTAGVRDPAGGKGERDRVLNEAEIRALWQVCEEIKYPWGPLIQLLILTGQREREVGDLPWRGELDLEGRVWSLPSNRAKNRKANTIHLSDLALAILNGLPRFAGQDFLFSINGRKPVTGYGDVKVRIDKRMAELLGDVPHWVFHDLRRSTATHMADLGVLPHVIEAVINHKSGVIRGMGRLYNRSEYAPEKKAALDAWGAKVERLVYPGRNVVALTRAR